MGVPSTSASEQTQQLNSIMSSEYLESLLSILTSSSSAVTSEERASYLKELLKLKLQESKELQGVIESMDPTELQAYLKKIYNGELAINDATVSVTYDILEQIAKEHNTTLEDFVKEEKLIDMGLPVIGETIDNGGNRGTGIKNYLLQPCPSIEPHKKHASQADKYQSRSCQAACKQRRTTGKGKVR